MCTQIVLFCKKWRFDTHTSSFSLFYRAGCVSLKFYDVLVIFKISRAGRNLLYLFGVNIFHLDSYSIRFWIVSCIFSSCTSKSSCIIKCLWEFSVFYNRTNMLLYTSIIVVIMQNENSFDDFENTRYSFILLKQTCSEYTSQQHVFHIVYARKYECEICIQDETS